MFKRAIVYGLVFGVLVVVCCILFIKPHEGFHSNPIAIGDGIRDGSARNAEEWTVHDSRPLPVENNESYVQIAVIGLDGNPIELTLIQFDLIDSPKLEVTSDSPNLAESVLMSLLEKAPESWPGGATLVGNRTYRWSYADHERLRIKGGVTTTPVLVPGQKKYLLVLRPEPKQTESPVVDIRGTLPPECPLDSVMSAGYFVNGSMFVFRLPVGKRDFHIRVPAYGGELSVEDSKKNVSVLYKFKVSGPDVGKECYRAIGEARNYHFVFTANDKRTVLEFLERGDSHVPVGGARIAPGTTTADVLLIPGIYWIRRSITEGGRNFTEKPLAKLEIKDQLVIDISMYDKK